MQIIANGETLKVLPGTTLKQLLEIMEEPARPDMLVALNKRIIPPKDYATAVLQEGDSAETIYIGFGG
jgi:thiamine biosynthesis protein ThiS